MTRLFVGNFAFEESLTGDAPSAATQRIEAEQASVWAACCQPGDQILFALQPDDGYAARMKSLKLPGFTWCNAAQLPETKCDRLIPWGWTAGWQEFAQQHCCESNLPGLNGVRRWNSREFQWEVCTEYGCLLDGEGCFHDAVAVVEHLEKSNGQRFVIKANFGFAGRGQRRVATTLTEADHRWLTNTLHRTGAVTVEPWLKNVCELGGQWEISQQGEVQLIGLTHLLSTSQGAYAGTCTRLPQLAQEFASAVVSAQRNVIELLRDEGYAGPVGIDAMLHEYAGEIRLRPVQDVNVRWTMGRLALAWRDHFRRIGVSEEGTWRHATHCDEPTAMELAPRTWNGAPARLRHWWIPSE